jgi:trimeric autotransporter adhesin
MATGGSGAGQGDGIDAFPGTASALVGSFGGDVHISGNLNVSGTKSFRIDHPLDPANKYFFHAALESSEVLSA